MSQDEGESFDSFATRLKTQIKKCNFGDLTDSIIVDKIIIGINNEDLRKKLLTEDDPTVEKLTKICRINEQTAQQITSMANSKTVDAVQVKSKWSSDKKPSQKSEDEFDLSQVRIDAWSSKIESVRHTKRSAKAVAFRDT